MQNARAVQKDVPFTFWVAFTALLPRLYVAIAWAREPVWDGHYYDFGAQRIAAGLGYSDDILVGGAQVWHPWCHYPVGYSGFLGALYRVFGAEPWVAPVSNVILGALIVALTHRIALYFLSQHRARIAALLCAAHPGLILYSALVMTELLATVGPLLALWLALHDRKAHPRRAIVTSGVALGLSTLVHPQTILLAPVMGLVLEPAWSLGGVRRMAIRGALSTMVALAVVAPWTLRNCLVMDGCAFVSTNGGWNLAIGALPRATGRFVTLRASDGCAVVTGQVQQDRCWASAGLEAIQADPGRWLRLAPEKLGQCFNHQSFPIEYLREADPQAWPESRRVWWRGMLTFVHRLLLSVAALGFLSRGSRRARDAAFEIALLAITAGLIAYAWTDDETNPFYPLAVLIPIVGAIIRPSAPYRGPVGAFIIATFGFFIVTHVAFFGEDRYQVPLIPLLCLLAAGALRSGRN